MLCSIFNHITAEWIFFQIIIINIILIPYILQLGLNQKGEFIWPKIYYSKNIIIFLLLIFCIFASYDGDYFSYLRLYDKLSVNINAHTHLEGFYLSLIEYQPFHSYILFRLIIWGGGLLFYYIAFRRLRINSTLIWVIFTASTLLNIAYLRVFIGMGCALLGYTYLIRPSNTRTSSFILGICFLGLSLVMHKSTFILVFAAIYSLFATNKWMYIISSALIPIISRIMILFIIYNYDQQQDGMNYLNAPSESAGKGAMIYNLLNFVIVAIPLGVCIFDLFKKRLSRTEKHITSFAYAILYIYILFVITFGDNDMGGRYLCERIFLMIYTVFPILLYIVFTKNRNSKLAVLIFVLSIIACNYRLLYSYYLQSMGLGINLG